MPEDYTSHVCLALTYIFYPQYLAITNFGGLRPHAPTRSSLQGGEGHAFSSTVVLSGLVRKCEVQDRWWSLVMDFDGGIVFR